MDAVWEEIRLLTVPGGALCSLPPAPAPSGSHFPSPYPASSHQLHIPPVRYTRGWLRISNPIRSISRLVRYIQLHTHSAPPPPPPSFQPTATSYPPHCRPPLGPT